MAIGLLDSFNVLFRSFVTLPRSITDTSDRPIHAVYGMLSFVLRVQRLFGIDSFVAAFDEPMTPTFRHILYPPYQAQRGPMGGDESADFLRQVDEARRLLPVLGIPSVSRTGFEADDVMGSLALELQRGGKDAIVISTDRDVLQLVRDPGVRVLVPGKDTGRMMTREDVRERLGVYPEAVPTLKALAGDASDNLPGVRGIGSKTAIGLVERHSSLDEIYAHLVDLSPRTGKLLRAGRDIAYVCLRLATIVTDLDTDHVVTQVQPIDTKAKVRDLLAEGGL